MTTEPGICGYYVFIALWPGDVRCECITSPQGKADQVKFARKRIRELRRGADYPQAKVVVNPILEGERLRTLGYREHNQ